MRRATIVAWASAAVAISPASPVTACPVTLSEWRDLATLPPDPTVHLVPWRANGPVSVKVVDCGDAMRPPAKAPPAAPLRATKPDDARHVGSLPTLSAPRWQPWALELHIRDADGRAIAFTAQRSAPAIGDTVALRLAIWAGNPCLRLFLVRVSVPPSRMGHRSRAPFDVSATLLAALWLTRRRRRLHLVAPPIG